MLEFIKRILSKNVFKLRFIMNKSRIGKIISCYNHKYVYIGKNIKIKDFCRIDCYKYFGGEEYFPSLVLNNGVNISYYFTCLIADKCIIGEETIIAHNVSIITENHGNNIESIIPIHAQKLTTGPCIIGKNCWIGCNVVFLPNSEIGNNCIVAANSTVTKKFPSNVIIGGSPARILKIYNFKNHCWDKFEN